MALNIPIVNNIANLVGGFLSSFAVDVVGVYTQDYTQVFPNARPMKATVKPESKLMEQPIETGETIIDHQIFLPIEIELSLILDANNYRDTYQQIKQLYTKSELLLVQTRADIYQNQIIYSMPHEESPEIYDTVVIALKLREVKFANTIIETIQPQNPADSNTVLRGNQQGTDATLQQTGQADKSFTKKLVAGEVF